MVSKRASLAELHRSKDQIRSFLGQYPGLFLPLYRARTQYRARVVGKRTELVIEGYPRSANTFVVTAFQTAQECPIRIAHHLHAPAQVVQAAKWSIPTLVLIRRPEDAVVSRVIRKPLLSVDLALRDYIRFYSTIHPVRDSFVVATFDEVISDLSSVIRRVNGYFGCDFGVFEHTTSNVERVFEIVEHMDLRDTGKDAVCEDTAARPSTEKERKKSRLKEELTFCEELLTNATRLYRELTDAS